MSLSLQDRKTKLKTGSRKIKFLMRHCFVYNITVIQVCIFPFSHKWVYARVRARYKLRVNNYTASLAWWKMTCRSRLAPQGWLTAPPIKQMKMSKPCFFNEGTLVIPRPHYRFHWNGHWQLILRLRSSCAYEAHHSRLREILVEFRFSIWR